MFENGVYEKSLCHVKAKRAYSGAQTFCNGRKMQLYRANSPKSIRAASQTAITIFGGDANMFVYIEGKVNNNCATLSGDGENSSALCQTPYKFFCEFVDKGEIYAFNVICLLSFN